MERVPRAEESEEQLTADQSQSGSWQESCEVPLCFHNDSYADTSIDFSSHSSVPMDEKEARRLVMKRKVLRHRPDGSVEVSDESPSIEPDTNTNPWNLGYSMTFMDDNISEGETETSSGTLEDVVHDDDDDDDDWFLEDRSYSQLGDFGSDTTSNRSAPGRLPTVAAYIAPQADRAKRTDPVARLNAYRQEWKRFSFPGQDSHQGVRWAVRRQMLESGLPRRAQKRLVPNTYEVPTMKKRDSLRFGVRWDLAHCYMPRRNTHS